MLQIVQESVQRCDLVSTSDTQHEHVVSGRNSRGTGCRGQRLHHLSRGDGYWSVFECLQITVYTGIVSLYVILSVISLIS